jgi:hypothetical protein
VRQHTVKVDNPQRSKYGNNPDINKMSQLERHLYMGANRSRRRRAKEREEIQRCVVFYCRKEKRNARMRDYRASMKYNDPQRYSRYLAGGKERYESSIHALVVMSTISVFSGLRAKARVTQLERALVECIQMHAMLRRHVQGGEDPIATDEWSTDDPERCE